MSGDIYNSSVTLRMHFDGSNGSTTWVDSSTTTPKTTFTQSASSPIISTAQSKFGGSSLYNDGSQYLRVEDHADWDMSGDFTMEIWAYWSAAPVLDNGIFTLRGSGWEVAVDSTGVIKFYNGTSNVISSSAAAVSYNVWHHIALVRSGTTVTLYLDGVSQGSSTQAAALTLTGVYVGAFSSTLEFMSGYLDEFRITKGVARYTSDFTPSASAFPDSTYGIVGSGNITLSGTSTFGYTIYYNNLVGSGNITLSGTSTFDYVPQFPTIVGSGNITLSGTSSFSYDKHYFITGSGSLVFSGTSTFNKKNNGVATSSISLSSTLLYYQLDSIYENITLLLGQSTRTNNYNLINDYFNVLDSILISLNGNISETLTLTSTLSGVIHQIETIVSIVILNEDISTRLSAVNQIVSLLKILDSLDQIYVGSVVETITLAESMNSLYKAITTILESIVNTDSTSMKYIQMLYLSDNISIDGVVSTKANLINNILEPFILSIPTSSGQDTYLSYLLLPETSSVSNYNNYNFDGCTKFDSKYLFFNNTGLYEYGGTRDDGTLIKTYIETVAYNFGSSNIKQVPAIYLGWMNTGTTILKVRVDGKSEVVYKLNKKTNNLQTQKINIGKGLIGRYFQFEIINNVDAINLESIEFYPVELKRKL